MNLASPNGESLTPLFRSLGQRKKSGVLELTRGEEKISVELINGRIVGVRHPELISSSAVFSKLLTSGRLPSEAGTACDESMSFEELREYLVDSGYVSLAEFKRAKINLELDVLHRLSDGGEITHEFIPKIPVVNSELALNLSPVQLLLDLVQLDADSSRLRELIGEGEALVRQETPEHFSEAEEQVWSSLQIVSGLEKIRERCLLSEHELLGALVSLLEGHHVVAQSVAPATPVRAAMALEVPADTKVDLQFPEANDGITVLDVRDAMPNFEMENVEKKLDLASAFFQSPPTDAELEVSISTDVAVSDEQIQVRDEQPEVVCQVKPEHPMPRSWIELRKTLNFILLDPGSFHRVAFGLSLVHLLVVAGVLWLSLQNLLSALTNFTQLN